MDVDARTGTLALLVGTIHFSFHLFMRLVPPLIPVLAVTLSLPLWKLGLLVSGYFLGSSVGLLPMGVLSDSYDRRATLSVALAVVGGGYLLFGLSPSLGTALPTFDVAGHTVTGPYLGMVCSLFVAGIGTSAHVPVGVPLLTANATPETRGRLLGVWGAGSKFGDAATPAVVGVLITVLTWDRIVLLFSVLSLCLAGLLFVVLGSDRFDTAPARTDESDGRAGRSRVSLDRRYYLYPMVALMGYFAAYQVVVQGVLTFVPTFLTDVYAYSLTLGAIHVEPESFADFVLSILLVGAGLSRFVGGVLVDRYEHRTVLFGSLVVAAVALAAVAVLVLSAAALVATLVVFGAMLWGNSPARDSLISDMTPAEREGRTFSYLFTASRVFGALSPVLVGLVADTVGIRTGFQYLAVVTVVAALFVATLFSDRVFRTPTAES